ncbi:hypothetical protein AAF712_011784 [Marasmius tenuissimus]|uniref:F-box domain-containing protein n=1 Tax=Marasmius tenuissimus TaxID=585030 RepID=A0ABR2ZJK4_9AGAR
MSPASKGAFEKILDILPQCRLLDIKLDHRFISAALSSPPATGWTTLPHLTTLALRLADPGPQIVNTTRWFWEAIRTGSPNLKHVTTNELHIQQAGFTIFPYAQLTSLEVLRLAETQSRNLRNLLPSCSSLETLKVGYYDPPEGPGTGLLSFVVPTLQELDVTVMQFPDQLVPLFREFTFPHLCALKVSLRASTVSPEPISWVSKRADWNPRFLDQLKESVGVLENLSFNLDNPRIPDGVLPVLPIIRVTTGVKRLYLHLGLGSKPSCYGAMVLNMLEDFNLRTDLDPQSPEGRERRSLVPQLEKLLIRDEWMQGPGDSEVRLVLDVVESRMKGVGSGTLEVFEMIYRPSPPEPVSITSSCRPYHSDFDSPEDERIREIRERGVTCTIEPADPTATPDETIFRSMGIEQNSSTSGFIELESDSDGSSYDGFSYDGGFVLGDSGDDFFK